MYRTFLALVVSCAALPALATPVWFDSAWRTQKFSLFSSNTYNFGGNTVSMTSEGSVSLAYRGLEPSYWDATTAQWSWEVEEGVPATDLRKKGGDDRNLALYFLFVPTGQVEALQGASMRRLMTNDAARVLVYVWGGEHTRGSVLMSPYLGQRGRTIVLRGAGTGRANESINFVQDYAKAFGTEDVALVGLALSGDSDDTDTRIRASLSGLRVN